MICTRAEKKKEIMKSKQEASKVEAAQWHRAEKQWVKKRFEL